MSVTDLLGSYPIIGGLITVLAIVAFIAWDYLRLRQGGRWFSGVLTARWIAIVLGVISVILMGSRFIAVLSGHVGF